MSFQFETIETPRLLLKKISPPEYIYIMDNMSDEELMAFLDFTPELVARDRERRAQGVNSFLCSFVYFVLVDKETGKTIGSCGYYRYYPQHFRGEVGYILTDESYRQRGLIKEVMPYVLAYGFNQMNLHRIEAIVGPNNVPSLRIMELFGFTREGMMREHYHINGKNEDSVVFSLLRNEYKF